jgi:hypothetical protein
MTCRRTTQKSHWGSVRTAIGKWDSRGDSRTATDLQCVFVIGNRGWGCGSPLEPMRTVPLTNESGPDFRWEDCFTDRPVPSHSPPAPTGRDSKARVGAQRKARDPKPQSQVLLSPIGARQTQPTLLSLTARVRTGFRVRSRSCPIPVGGSTIWWDNSRLKQGVPTYRPDAVRLVSRPTPGPTGDDL